MYHNVKEIKLPAIKPIQKPTAFEYGMDVVHDQCVLYTIPGTQNLDLVKLEIVLNRGRFNEQKKLSSRFCARMLKEGTQLRNQDDINDVFDFFGAQFNVQYHLDYASFTLVCLTQYCRELFPLVFEILSKPAFDSTELNRLKKRAKSKLKLSLADNDSLSYRILTEKIFGPDHPYGYNSSVEDIEAVTTDDLFEFHQKNYRLSNFRAYLSGSFDQAIHQDLLAHLHELPSDLIPEDGHGIYNVHNLEVPGVFTLKNQYAFDTQSSIKMGKRIIQRSHPDYIPVHFVNTLLGGFFGSRLMQNIREKEGLTYNIYSDLEPMFHDAYFIIGTDVKTENIEKVIGLIHDELDKLEQKLISQQEFGMVRNYIKGYLLSSLDGVFSKAEILKILTLENLSVDWIYNFFDRLDDIVVEDVPELVKKYLKKDELYTVVVN
ncbi:MAG TPA: pitrilysin family protein [Membranihabitans sp.]|nr:pitrilysin family protein [Membranihabitans sp.]